MDTLKYFVLALPRTMTSPKLAHCMISILRPRIFRNAIWPTPVAMPSAMPSVRFPVTA